ncbi:hypothetical protein AMD26_009620 [Deinococcus sp. UR1]|nr:hypothetical protein AMD26_009620 [Deinococcus sp. UR1]
MIWLSARRPAGLLALTLGLPGFVLTGWLIGRVAVLGLSSFELLKAFQEDRDLRFELTDACLETFTVWAGGLADRSTLPNRLREITLLSSYELEEHPSRPLDLGVKAA